MYRLVGNMASCRRLWQESHLAPGRCTGFSEFHCGYQRVRCGQNKLGSAVAEGHVANMEKRSEAFVLDKSPTAAGISSQGAIMETSLANWFGRHGSNWKSRSKDATCRSMFRVWGR
jgi:hypothetical protein